VEAGAVHLLASLFSDADTFYQQSVLSVNTIFPDIFVDADTFYPAVIITRQELAPDLYADPDAFYSTTVSLGIQNLYPALFTNINVLYHPLVQQPYEINPSRVIKVTLDARTSTSHPSGRTARTTAPKRTA
jgi:hypothetical protein